MVAIQGLFFSWLARACMALALLAGAVGANARELPLRGDFRQVASQTNADWTWLELNDTALLADLPADWVLQIDQVRFSRIAVIATSADGDVHRTERSSGDIADIWRPGGVMAFTVAPRGAELARLQLGIENIDDLHLLRKITALTPTAAARTEARWLLLMGIYAGLLVSALAYNLFVFAGHRYPFQRWYIGWVVAALAYGMTWTGLSALFHPALAGPTAVRIDAALVALVVALGSKFLVSVLERGKVPDLLHRGVNWVSAACVVTGLVAACDPLIDASTGDLLLNAGMIACVVFSFATVMLAAVRGSRLVWLYLIGWVPVVMVFVCRASRNLGFVGQSDFVDMATFAAIGFESLIFSLVIAGRFSSLRRQRDAAEASARGMEIEQETLRRAAHADFLTGLGNRAFFHDHLRRLFESGRPFSLFLVDVDYLKDLNDRQGHDAGDALLQHIGGLLAELSVHNTHCARIGGDEFAILVEGTASDAAQIQRHLDDLQGRVWGSHTWSGTLSLSIGYTSAEGALSAADLFQRADIALYEAKRLGRGRLESFDQRLQDKIQHGLDLIREAHWGLRRGEFVLHFQPIIDVRSSTVVSVEALLRWNHPTRGLIGPADFQPVLANAEIGRALQQHVLTLAIEQLQRRPDFTGTLAVNFTAMDLEGRTAAKRILAKLAAAGVSPRSLCVEVTEGIILGKAGNEPSEALRELHEAGVQIALDDFGTGYASLVHLKEIPVDTLKIDRSFIAGLVEEGDHSEEIVRAVLALGHGLSKTVIAEGIETVGQLLRLQELGCDYAQGYLFGRPVPAFPSVCAGQAAA